MQHHNDTINKQTSEGSFIRICTSHFIVRFEKVIQGFTVRGSWRPNRNCNTLTQLLWPSALCLSHSPDAQLEARGLTLLAFSTTSYQQLLWTPTHQGPKGPLHQASLPHLVF